MPMVSYTMFVPTDSAVKIYLTEVKQNLKQFNGAGGERYCSFICQGILYPTPTFKDGKLPVVTMYGQYLTTAVINKAGVSVIEVNRQVL